MAEEKHKADGTKHKDFFYYACKHRTMTRGHKCDYKKQIHEELLDNAVAEVIVKLVSNPKFATMMQEKINMKVDTAAIEQEIANYEKQLRQSYSVKSKLIEEIDTLDPDDKHYIKCKSDLDDRFYKMYDMVWKWVNTTMLKHLMSFVEYEKAKTVMKQSIHELDRVINDKLIENNSEYLNDLEMVVTHITTSSEMCGRILQHGIVDLVKAYETVNSELRRFLD